MIDVNNENSSHMSAETQSGTVGVPAAGAEAFTSETTNEAEVLEPGRVPATSVNPTQAPPVDAESIDAVGDESDESTADGDETQQDQTGCTASNSDDCDSSGDFDALAHVPQISAHSIPDPEPVEDIDDDQDSEGQQPAPGRVEIIWHPSDLAGAAGEALDALVANQLPIFVHGPGLVTVGLGGSLHTDANVKIHALTASLLTTILSAVCCFVQVTANGFAPIAVPSAVVRAILAGPAWPFPLLRRLVSIPTLLPDGTLLDKPLFHEPSGLLYSPEPSLAIPPRPKHPTLADARAAVALFTALLCDVLFADPLVDLAAAIAAVITPIVRTAIDGCVPAFVFAAATPRIGKTELAQFVSLILTGAPAKVQAPRGDQEMEKRITGHVMAGDPMIVFDNGTAAIGGPVVESAVTARIYTGRLLRTNTFYTGPMDAVIFFTGNRVAFHDDMLGRVVIGQLVSDLEHISERPLKRPDAQAWILANRGELLVAALTICRAYIAAGSPDVGLKPFRGFDAWSRVVRSALVWTGLSDPLQKLAQFKSDADLETEAFGIALQQLDALFPDGAHFTAMAVYEALRGVPGTRVPDVDIAQLAEALKVVLDGADPVKLGRLKFPHAFMKLTDRNVGGLYLKLVRRGNHGREYVILRISR